MNDTAVQDTMLGDTTVRDTTLGDATLEAGVYGFPLRDQTEVSINGNMYPTTDHACSLRVDGRNALVYVRATPTGEINAGLSMIPVFSDVRAWLYDVTTQATREVSASYEWGGNHHNDFFTVTIDGQRYRYNHSCFNFGFRATQAVDCVQKLSSANDITTDGCMPTRSLPEACAPVVSANWPSLSPDPFLPYRAGASDNQCVP